jgi:hypothetical protein
MVNAAHGCASIVDIQMEANRVSRQSVTGNREFVCSSTTHLVAYWNCSKPNYFSWQLVLARKSTSQLTKLALIIFPIGESNQKMRNQL